MPRESRGDLAGRRWVIDVNEITSLSWSELRISGSDAVSFSQGQFSQSISGDQRATLLLAPDGHVVTGGTVAIKNTEVVFTTPTALAESALNRLRRFVLRVDVTISERDGADGPYGSPAELFASQWPSEYEWSLELPPHSFGQWVVDSAVSFTKGCFTGQELVGRADARGATMPWRFVGGWCDDLEAMDVALRSTGPSGPQGVTSYTMLDGRVQWRGFAHRTWVNEVGSSQVDFMA